MQLLAISVGIVPPVRPAELWLFLASILAGAVLYAVFVASLTAVFSELNASGREYRSTVARADATPAAPGPPPPMARRSAAERTRAGPASPAERTLTTSRLPSE